MHNSFNFKRDKIDKMVIISFGWERLLKMGRERK